LSLYTLFPDQQETFDALKHSFKKGFHRPLVYASCGFGKTILAAHVIHGALAKGLRVCFVVPQITLINQTAKSFVKQGLPQPGVIQADHPLTDPSRQIQVASVQTLSRRYREKFDLYIIDECHILYREIQEISEEFDVPMIGLSGTPFSRGLGRIYNNLVKATSMAELIRIGRLSEYIAYAPDLPDMSNIPLNAAGDYRENETSKLMSEAQVIGSVTDHWLKLGNNEPTICFAVNVAHANYLGSAFDHIGVTNKVITAKTPIEEREEIFDAYDHGEVKILVNVGTLTTGFDRDVRCIIFARPTKSRKLWVQKGGRGLRTAKGKDKCICIDHSGNFSRLGFFENITIDTLDQNEKEHPSAIKQEKEEYESLPKQCIKCKFLKNAGVSECPECGFTPRPTEDVITEEGTLTQIKGEKLEKTRAEKQSIFSQLKGYQAQRLEAGKRISDGWCAHTYKEMVGEWPNNMNQTAVQPESQVIGWIKHKNIKFAKSKK
jgi:superfamily II DNA or RNA helicase